MSDGALDLSAKTEARTSPTPSITSDVGETSINDSHERDISYPPRKLSPPDVGVGGLLGLASKMTPGNGLLTPPFSLPGGFPGFSDISQAALGLGVGVGGSSHSGGGGSAGARPFKMYPMDPLSNIFPGATGMMPAGLDPTSPFGTGLLDSSHAMSSPITQYIQQRKRRAESRMTTNNDSLEEHIARTNGKGSLPGRPRLPSPNGGNLEQGTATIQSADSSDQPNYAPVVPGEFDGIPAKLARMENGSPFSGDEGGPNERRDLAYWDRRRKNNEAAKRSRDTRRVKEEEIALRAAYLEQENLKLRAQVSILKNETQKLHFMLFNRL